jgi:ABC-type uncharacterized transport system ATPase subunit
MTWWRAAILSGLMPAAVETTDLTRDFGGFRAVDRISLHVERGRFRSNARSGRNLTQMEHD